MHDNPYYIAELALIIISQAQRRALEAFELPDSECMPEGTETSVEGSIAT